MLHSANFRNQKARLTIKEQKVLFVFTFNQAKLVRLDHARELGKLLFSQADSCQGDYVRESFRSPLLMNTAEFVHHYCVSSIK